MPIYEYQCQSCAHRLEALQKISERPLEDCPACGAPALKKLMSASAFRLKGGGWYETDFKQDNQRNLAQQSSAEGAAKKSPDASGAESNTATGDAGDKKNKNNDGQARAPQKNATQATASASPAASSATESSS